METEKSCGYKKICEESFYHNPAAIEGHLVAIKILNRLHQRGIKARLKMGSKSQSVLTDLLNVLNGMRECHIFQLQLYSTHTEQRQGVSSSLK